ncbi:PhnD/SsuA/transferrin family substrate-binding protein [Methanolobus sp. WCC5]|uniref:PhnD/SsuA/transferrin family substrate-binding protein n=1 Tax=Methanolobus sp. WCC5 TaxID=3125785 RepID=UPI003247E08A
MLIVSSIFLPVVSCEQNVYRIGVLSVYGEIENSMDMWIPTAEYLSESIPGSTFEVIPLDYDELALAVAGNDVDFFYANPVLYMEMKLDHGAGSLATFHPVWKNSSYSGYGGIIFTRADRDDINSLKDLKGKSFMAVHENSFGGFLAGMGEIHRSDIDYRKDLDTLVFGQTQDAVILATINGDVDAGTVRAGTIEQMVLEGRISVEDIKVLGQKEHESYPFLVSTDIYPHWAFAKTGQTSDDISRQVSIALLSLPSESSAAAALDSAGWMVPVDYSSVGELMKELRFGPYADYGKVPLKEAIIQHWYILLIILMLVTIFEVHSRLIVEKKKKSRLEASNKLKDLFTDILRHDLLNPAGIIKGFGEMLYTEETDAQKKEILKMINDQSDHLIAMIGSAAKLAKIESCEEIQFTTKDIGPLLWMVADSLSPDLRAKDIKIDFDLKGEYPARINDVIEDVFSNLMSNAIKYSPQGSTIRTGIIDNGKSWKVWIADEGEGIPDDVKPYIFDRFKRADKKGIKGTGLGLAIVKRVVAIHNGSVGVIDNPRGKGSVFWVMLNKA